MTWWDHVRQDVRFGTRLLVRERALSAVVIAILALAVAANTAIYSVVDAIMFRPLLTKALTSSSSSRATLLRSAPSRSSTSRNGGGRPGRSKASRS